MCRDKDTGTESERHQVVGDLQALLLQNRRKVSTHFHLEVCGRSFWGEKTGLAIDYRQVGPALRRGGDKVKCDVSRSGK